MKRLTSGFFLVALASGPAAAAGEGVETEGAASRGSPVLGDSAVSSEAGAWAPLPGPPLSSAYFGEEIGMGTADLRFWLFGGFTLQERRPRSARFEEARALGFSVAGLFPNPKAPFTASLDFEFGRYHDPSVPAGEEYETRTAMISMSTWIHENVPLYLGAGAGAVSYELPSDPNDRGSGLALKVFVGGMFPVGRFDMALEYHRFWGNADGTVLDGDGLGVRVLMRF
jgi:hypothetical protein